MTNTTPFPDDVKSKVRSQFGASAELYAHSDVHAHGESLALLIEFVNPQPTWRVLDVATGAGHTALCFAPRVAEVIATDLTAAMLATAARLAGERKLANVRFEPADAELLTYPDGSFDAVTCRLAFHHFPNPRQALAEFARVLKPGGALGFTDNVTVENPSSAELYNAIEKLRDPSHVRVPPTSELCAAIASAGMSIVAQRRLSKEMEFAEWADRQHVSPGGKETLLAMFRSLPTDLLELFQPRWTDGTLYFSLWELVLAARKAGTQSD